MKKIILLLPLIILFLISLILLVYLLSGKQPNNPPSALLNKDTPIFQAVSLFDEEKILSNQNIKDKIILINFFASWCTPCKIEHPLFFELAKKNPHLYILGFNHKDKEEDAKKYLEDAGNPYNFVGIDMDGLIALEFGVFGLPETFLVNKDGKIIYKLMGPLSEQIIEDDIQPLL